jgi:uncharacterized protein YjbI with pentapeptide repeats
MNINGYEIKPGANLKDAELRGADLRYAILIRPELTHCSIDLSTDGKTLTIHTH